MSVIIVDLYIKISDQNLMMCADKSGDFNLVN